MCVLFMKNFLSPIRATWCVLDSFSPPEPKNVWFLLSRHGVRGVHEKLFSRRYERAIGFFTHFGLLSPKTFDSYFIDIMYVKFMRKFFQADSSELMGVRLISASRDKNVWFLLSRHHVRRVHEKYLLADSSQLMGVRLISASRARKRLIPNLHTPCTSNSWKIFFSPIRVNYSVLDSFLRPEDKNVSFLFSRHNVRPVHEKFSSADSSDLMGIRLISASWAEKRLISSF